MDVNDDTGIDVSGLSDADRGEVQKFLQTTTQQLQINKLVQSLTKTCWEKCIQTPISQGTLSSTEQSCASNCVARWLESQNTVIKTLAEAERSKRR